MSIFCIVPHTLRLMSILLKSKALFKQITTVFNADYHLKNIYIKFVVLNMLFVNLLRKNVFIFKWLFRDKQLGSIDYYFFPPSKYTSL